METTITNHHLQLTYILKTASSWVTNLHYIREITESQNSKVFMYHALQKYTTKTFKKNIKQKNKSMFRMQKYALTFKKNIAFI